MDNSQLKADNSNNPDVIASVKAVSSTAPPSVAQYSSAQTTYPIEDLEVHEQGVVAQAQSSAHKANTNLLAFSRRKAMIVSIAIALIVTLFTGASILILVRKAPKSQQSGQSLIQTQDVALNDAEITDLPSELQSTNSSLLVNGDVITRGELKVSNGTYVTVIKVEDVTANQTYTLPNSSGVFCLSSNNCNFVRSNVLDLTNATLTDLQNQVNAPVVAAAASFVNNLNGAVLLQGTTNQVNVTTGNGTITISAPQDLAQLSSPTFAGLNINGNLALTGTLTLPLDCTTFLNGGSLSTDNTGQVVCQNDESSGAGASVTTIGGTAGTIAMFTAGAEIANSIITQLSGTITIAGDLQAIGVDSGAGLLQGTGGFTITGNIALGSASDAFAITSSGLDVTTAGAVSGVTTLDISGNFTQTGATTLTTGTGTISLNGPTTVASNQQFTALGMALFRDSTNSATAFQIQNASSVPVLTVGTTYDTYTNLIPNGTFEADTPGVDPVGWVRYKSNPPQAGDPEIDTESNPTYVHAGSRSMEVVTTTNSNDGAIITSNVLLPNTSYVLSMWVEADGISIINDIVLGYATYGGAFPFDCTISKTTNGGGFVAVGWSQYTCSFNTPTDVTGGRIYVRRSNSIFATGVTFYIDDVRLHRTVGNAIQLGQIGTSGTSNLGQLQFAYDGGGRITLQPAIGSGLTEDYILTIPAESGVICTTSNVSPCTTGADGRYLSKITNDSASVAVSANNYLYYLNNTSSAVASGVLRLENNTNTGEALRIRNTLTLIDPLVEPDYNLNYHNTLLVNVLNNSTSRLKVFTSGRVAINSGSSLPSTDATFGDLSFGGGSGVIRTINVLASTASNTAGGSLVLAGGLGNGSQIGGTATLQGGAGGSSGIGGTAQILGGAAGASGNDAGGDVILTSGNGNGSGTGGTMSLTAGIGGSTGSGGGLSIQGGAAGASGNGAGGAVGITAGTANGSGTGGSITIQASNGGGTGNSNGGSVIIRAGGLGSGTGTTGSIQIGNLNLLGSSSTTQTIVMGGTAQTGTFVPTNPSSSPAITLGQYGGSSIGASVLNISAATATGNRQNFIFIGSGASNTSSGTNGGTVLTLGSNTSRSSVLIQGGNCNILTGGGICDVDELGPGGVVEAIRLETDPIGDIRIGGSAQTGILSVGTGLGAGNRDVRIGSTINSSTLLLQAGSGTGITLTTPTITVTNDTNFVLSGGVNALSFNTNTLSVDATNGRVGIGNIAPTTALDVTGATNISLGLTVGGNLKAGNGATALLNIAALVVNTFTSSNCAFGCYGVYSSPTADNTVGGAGASLVGFATSMATSNTAFTLGNAYGYFAANISRGAASTITSNYGVYVQNQTSGVSDYGVYIAGADTYALWVDAGATRLDGTLEVQGSTTLGDTSGDTLTINGTAVSIPNSLNIDTDTLYVDATTNSIGIGDATPLYALTVGNGDVFGVNSSGQLLFEGSTPDANELTITVADPTADRTYTIPNSSASTDTFCLVTLGNCAGSGSSATLQAAYDADVDGANAIIGLSGADGGILIRDNAVPLGSTLFAVQDSTGSTNYLNVSASGISTSLSVTLAANQTLNLTGGTTASRPGSPTEGMIYFDTDTDKLLVYGNGKWQADRSTATMIVSASNSSQTSRDSADYTTNGNTGAASDGDQIEINTALVAVAAAGGGTVYLTEGTYTVDASISVPTGVTLAGAGQTTLITIPNSFNADLVVVSNGDTNGSAPFDTGIVIRDLHIDGNASNQASNSQTGIRWERVGQGSGSGATVGGKIINVSTDNFRLRGIDLYESDNNTLFGNSAQGNTSGIYIGTNSENNVITGNRTQEGDYGINLDNANSNTLTGNVAEGAGSHQFDVYQSDYNTFTGNTASGNTASFGVSYGFNASQSDYNTFTGNTSQNNFYYGFGLSTSNQNVIAGNNIHNNGGTQNNGGIYLTTSDTNSITSNNITDTSCTITCYAIDISNAGSDANYLADNRYTSPANVNDTGTGTIFGGQSIGTNNFALQGFSAIGIGTLTPDAKLEILQVSTNTTADTLQGMELTVADTGAVNSGTDTTYGQKLTVTRTGATGGTINTYGLDIQAIGDTGGTSTLIGLSINVSGADTNYAALFQGGNVGIGDTTPSALLTVGAGDLFQVQSTGQIRTINGSAALPAYAFTGAGDMGLYAVGADNLGISTVGTERIRIDSNGDIGIGITSSGPTLSVGGSIALNDELFFAGQSATDYYINYAAGFELVQNSVQELFIDPNSHRWGIADATPDAKFDIDATFNPAATGTTNNTGIGLTVSNTVNKTSGVDNTYGQQLSVTRTGASGGAINNYGSVITVTGDSGGTSLNTGLSVTVSGADTNYAALFNGGNVGIGTNAPTEVLHVFGTSAQTLQIQGDATDQLGISINNTDNSNIASQPRNWNIIVAGWNYSLGVDAYGDTLPAGSLAIRHTGAGNHNSITIGDFGQVGIGVNQPNAAFHVGGDSIFTNSSLGAGAIGFEITGNGTNDATSNIFEVFTAFTSRFVINASSGYVGVGDATPAYQLTVGNGDLFGVNSSGNVQFSDDAHTVGVLTEATANGAGNALSISAGDANGSTTGAVGGALNLNAGAAAGSGDNNGGSIVLLAGTATVAGTGGGISLTAGSAGSGGFGGVISLQTGANASSSYGALTMQASGGKVFIGNSNPLSSTGRLDLSLGSTSTAGLIVRGVASQTADFIQIRSLNSAGVTDGDILALTASGNLGIGDASPDAKLDVQQSGDTVAIFNRTADDGTIISLQQDGTEEGTISVSGNTISYNAFTGSHYADVSGNVNKGELVSYTGTNSYIHNNPQSEIIYGATKTVTENNPNVLGAYLSRQVPAKPYSVDNPYLVMAVGNGVMWVVDEGQDVSPGDYFISSSTAGHARKDPRTAPTSHIVGRAAESINWNTVSATIGGKKHALVSVTYEVFARDNNFIAGQSLQAQTASFESLQVTGMANISNLNVSGATQLASLTVTGNTVIQGTLVVQGDTKVMSLYVGGKLISTGSVPSASLGGALTGVLGASISNDGTDTAGTVHINTGSQTIAQSGILAEIVFTSAYATPPKIVISGNNSQSAKSGAYVIRTATGFQIVIDDVPQQDTTYEFDYIIIETQNP